ncbi:hypothetical protein PU634_10445 [Oceanimonas pelagia]|uniref:Uncharacterized protein n=1 Tax=Oceanimonas pelagia TaxID=3028314 RepID=A0AA50Q6M1_9GAMM|nr:hypothetical protein [Oceanimonas pelagia]WMC09535.1 hypothetical protein PU634_10445 [Oceanimonas pelagia]
MAKQIEEAVSLLRKHGCLVVLWYPEEIEGVQPGTLKGITDRLVEMGNEMLDEADRYSFSVGDLVRHVKTGGCYHIRGLPDKHRLEATGEPAYLYEAVSDGLIWMRSQAEMEDGRFVMVPGGLDMSAGAA